MEEWEIFFLLRLHLLHLLRDLGLVTDFVFGKLISAARGKEEAQSASILLLLALLSLSSPCST